MKRSFHFFFLFCFSGLYAQTDLPRYMTAYERELLSTYTFPGASERDIVTPPGGSLRAAAEWEEIQTLLVRWGSYSSEIRQIINAAKDECEVLILCTDSTVVKNNLISNGIQINSNIKYLETPTNSVWMRDYAANTVYRNDVDSILLVDWIYNRPRPSDDSSPTAVANYKGIPLYKTTQAPYDLVHTGGNYMSDGFGNAFSSKLILEDNGPLMPFNTSNHSEQMIDSIMKLFMGIESYIKMETLPYDGIHHIDMHMKLLDEETLLVGEYPSGIADGPQIEANLQYVLSNFNSKWGTPFKVIRIPMPPQSNGSFPPTGDYLTYTNFVFVNKTIIMPVYRPQYDTTAIRIVKSSLPGYRVVGIDSDNIIQASGAIHCITHSIGVNDPLLISHQRLNDTYDSVNPYVVEAFIKHNSGISAAALYWTIDTAAGYNVVPMSAGAQADTYTGLIPAQAAGTEVFYYIEGSSVSGKTLARPMPAPQGYWKFNVLFQPSGLMESTDRLLEPYPNPGKGITCIPFRSVSGGRVSVALYNAFGAKVRSIYEGSIMPGEKNFFTDCTTLEQGVYFVRVQTANGGYTKKLLVK